MTSSVITSEIQKLAPGTVIELFVLDTTAVGGDISYFHSGTNELNTDVVWQGQVYTRYPVEASGFEYTGNGQIPRPRMRVSNAFGSITALILELGDMIGSKVIRKRTLKKCLDAVNFEGGVNPDEDTSVEWPEEVYFVDRKVSEGPEIAEFELTAAFDLQGIQVPKRQIIQNVCPFIYRGADCGFTGAPIIDFEDNVMTTASTAEGQALLDAYQETLVQKQLWENSIADTEAAKKAQEIACDYVRTDAIYQNLDSVMPPNYGVTITRGYVETVTAYWNSVQVTLGITYRIGDQVGVVVNTATTYYKIERWAVDVGNCSAKGALYDAAVLAQAAALAAYETAINDYEAAFLALPEDDPLYSLDSCGKRINSCKARFGENNPLSFGGFPSAALIK